MEDPTVTLMLISTASPPHNVDPTGKKQKRSGSDNPLQRVKTTNSQLEQNNAYFLEKVRDAEACLSLVAMTVAASVQAKTLVYSQKDLRKGLTRSCLPPAPPMRLFRTAL